MKNTTLFILLSISIAANAQQHITREGQVSFFSSTPLEDIEAETTQMSAILDLTEAATARFAFQVPVLTFHFEKALMEEHFNESYLESEKFPRSTFEGTIENWDQISSQLGWVDVVASGSFSLHGISKARTISGQVKRTNDSWEIRSSFDVLTADHDIKIPKMVRKQIAEKISVTVNAELSPR